MNEPLTKEEAQELLNWIEDDGFDHTFPRDRHFTDPRLENLASHYGYYSREANLVKGELMVYLTRIAGK